MDIYTDIFPSYCDYYSNRKHVCPSISMVCWSRALNRGMTVLASFRLLRSCYTDCVWLCIHKFPFLPSMKSSFPPHSYLCMLFLFLMIAILMEWEWISTAFVFCISLLVKNGKHFYNYLLVICISSEIVYSVTMSFAD